MQLARYYKNAILYPSIIIIAVIIPFSIIENYDYDSEWMTSDSVIFLATTIALLYCLAISILALTIFLNKLEKVRVSRSWSFLSWFLLPFCLIITVLVHEIILKIKYSERFFSSDFIYVLILNLPFMLGLGWNYYRYRQTVTPAKSAL
ncbi:MAG: hypothetical protein QM791_10270 [Ferruginibacter sp.]